MWQAESIFVGASRKPDDSYQRPEELLLKYGNRHGLVTGATGTGKTVTLQVLAEGGGKPGPSFLVCGRSAVHGINSTSRFNAGITAESRHMA